MIFIENVIISYTWNLISHSLTHSLTHSRNTVPQYCIVVDYIVTHVHFWRLNTVHWNIQPRIEEEMHKYAVNILRMRVVDTTQPICTRFTWKKLHVVMPHFTYLRQYSPNRRRSTHIRILIVDLWRLDDRFRFIMGIPISVRRCLFSE